MIVSTRLFLVLFLPLLVHGAPAPPHPGDVVAAPHVSPPASPHHEDAIIRQYILPMTVFGLVPGFQISDNMNPRPVGGIKPRPIITLGPPSHTVHVLDVIPDDSANDVYLVPPDTTYRLVGIAHGRGKYSLPKLYHIPDGYKTITSDAVATTDSGVTILLAKPPDKTSIRVRISSDPIICLSAHDSKSRVIYDMDRKKIRKWCQEVYKTSVVPHGMQRPKLNTYLNYCTFVNLWHVSTSTNVDADDHQFVNVLVFEPIPERQPLVRPDPIP